ncbi:cation-translocating P-type ATPase [Permianibacter sp. IMCC34836]|uniref:cation-translocating P-type ATPase n=1 Tax=Permianibacter fluminis TaxID=2738515 RepID=UPI0015520EB4|nr:cation-translocating P-type ATPase [Permianibacter fluminis]NQD35861.1 cation-translocating P-type ATPase [Permianibacter fluminis]
MSQGLSSSEAAQRLLRDGGNELPAAQPRSLARLLIDVLREPMLLMLVGCSAVYLLFGEPRDAAVLGIAMLAVVGITLYQERKTEHALAALRDWSSPRALVLRDGQRVRIAGREVVVGDWLILSEGDRVPADAVLRDANHLQVDESLLTGESVPVRKHGDAALARLDRPGGDDTALVFSGTLITSGHGVAEVLATGKHSELGRIGKALQSQAPGASALQRETRALVRRVAIIAIALSLLVLLLYGLSRGQWLQAFLAAISVAMGLLPEEFPVVLTVFMALGAWRMSRQHVLTRRLTAIEALGAATVLCVDKTGTLTENRMTVSQLLIASGETFAVSDQPLPESTHQLIEFALLASRTDPFDPMERAIRELGLHDQIDAGHLHRDWRMLREYPLSRELLAMSQLWQTAAGDQRVIAAKGAPEAIADLCHLDAKARATLLQQVTAFADQGLRVLAVARAELMHSNVAIAGDDGSVGATVQTGQTEQAEPIERTAQTASTTAHDYAFEWLGLLALRDPVRPQVPAAVQACREAGIRVLMITGDYPGTAISIARQAGLAAPEAVLLGRETEQLDDATLAQRLAQTSVIARAIPEHKLRIVKALQASGEVVAMTGDGVNDAPALRAADIGIAMGGRGTDVAREAAAIVLTDDNFRSIVDAVRSGRRIFRNLRRAMAYLIAVHVPIAGLCFLPLLFGWPMLLLPAHIALLELVIDPACSIVFEAEPDEPTQMQQPPRAADSELLSRRDLLLAVGQGSVLLLAVLIVVGWARWQGLAEPVQRALGFTLLMLGNLALILSNRDGGWLPFGKRSATNTALSWALSATLLVLIAVLTAPGLQRAFRFALPTIAELGMVFALALALLYWLTRLNRRRATTGP